MGPGRAVERENAGDGLARQAVGARGFRRDAERSAAAVLMRNGFEVGQLLGGEKDVLHTAVEMELLHVADGGPEGVHVIVAYHQPVDAIAAINDLARENVTGMDHDGVVAAAS